MRLAAVNTLVLARRVLTPAPIVSLLCLWRYGAQVSPRAEVELSRNLRMGRGVRIGSFSKVKSSGGPMRLGDGVQIATGCFIDSRGGGLEIGANSLVGPNCVILSSTYRYAQLGVALPEQGYESKGVRIGRNVMIGANSVVLDGTVIEDDVIISPGTLVSGHFPAGAVVSGNPAKVIFKRR